MDVNQVTDVDLCEKEAANRDAQYERGETFVRKRSVKLTAKALLSMTSDLEKLSESIPRKCWQASQLKVEAVQNQVDLTNPLWK